MLRVIGQELAHERAWDTFLAGNARKDETFDRYARRVGGENRTPPPVVEIDDERDALIESVKRRLGRFYRPPIQA